MSIIRLSILILVLNIGLQSANCQFYVDIEHALPRFGKRAPNERNEDVPSLNSNSFNAGYYNKVNAILENKVNLLYKLLGLNYKNAENL